MGKYDYLIPESKAGTVVAGKGKYDYLIPQKKSGIDFSAIQVTPPPPEKKLGSFLTSEPVQPQFGLTKTSTQAIPTESTPSTVNAVKAVPQLAKSLAQGIATIPASFAITAGQAGLSIFDKATGSNYTELTDTGIPTGDQSWLFGKNPIKGYGSEILDLSEAIHKSLFAQKYGLDKLSLPLAFAGTVSLEASNFFGGGEGKGAKAFMATARAIPNTAEGTFDAYKLMRGAGFEHDIATQYAPLFAAEATVKGTKKITEAAVKLQNTTHGVKPPVGSAVTPPVSVPLYHGTAGKFDSFDDAKPPVGSAVTPPVSVPLYHGTAGKFDSFDDAKKITTKSQLIEPYDKSHTLPELPKLPKKVAPLSPEIQAMTDQLAFLKGEAVSMPGAKLEKFVSKATGKLPEVTGKKTKLSTTGSGRIVRTSRFEREGDQIIQEVFGYENAPDIEAGQKAVDDYRGIRKKIAEMQTSIRQAKRESADIKIINAMGKRLEKKRQALIEFDKKYPQLLKATQRLKESEIRGVTVGYKTGRAVEQRAIEIKRSERVATFRGLGEVYSLSDTELDSIRGGKNIVAMTDKEFDEFIGIAELRAVQMSELSEAKIQLKGTVFEKELRNWENVREAMKLPHINEMNMDEIKKLNDVLSQYKEGDIFLTTRQLETIHKTELTGLKTEREVLEHLAKKTGVTEIPKDIKPHPWMYDTQLARQDPFYKLLVEKYNVGYLRGMENTLKNVKEHDDLIIAARKSRPRTLVQRLVPTDEKVVQWKEADEVMRETLAKDMTPEELRAAQFEDIYFREVYDWMLNRELGRKFTSRFEDTYFPHTRRGFLEAWKENGFLKGAKEQFGQFKQDEAVMTILNKKTGEILPYSKWNKFEQFRTGELIPSKNAAKAFRTYVTTIEKVKQFDEFIPEMMIYVHTLSPKGLTQAGLKMDDTLKQFFKKWINSKKGRVEKQIVTPGGKLDWALRTSVALLRVRDLGLNLATQVVSLAGEQAGNIIMLRLKTPIGIARLATKQGQMITKKYENFVGKSIYDRFTDPAEDIGDKLMTGVMGLFGGATRKSNQTFLLSMMTDAEFKAGEISLERLAFLRNKVGRYRVVEGAESVIGKSAEAAVVKQHKKWAIPMLVTTANNLTTITKNIRKDGIKALASEEGAELLTATLLSGTIALASNAYYTELKEKKDRNVVEDLIFKATRESLSLITALDPRFIVGFATPRLVSFLEDMSNSLMSIAKMEEYVQGEKEGQLKGVEHLKRTITPVVVSQLTRDKKEVSGASSAGLPKLPKLPSLPKLPKL